MMPENETLTSTSPVTPAEVKLMIEQVKHEGCNPGIHDVDTLRKINPDGLLCSRIEGEPIGFSSVMIYDQEYAYFGHSLVYEKFRGLGYGMEMTRKRLAIAGKRCIGVDATTGSVDMYSRIGFRPSYRNLRFTLAQEHAPHPQSPDITVTRIVNIPEYQLRSFDHCFFPACRGRFLNIWCHQTEAIALGAIRDGELEGYIVARPCIFGSRAGPLFARSIEAAWELIAAAAGLSLPWPFTLDIPEPNFRAVTLASKLKMEFISEVTRMHIGTPRSIDLSGVYSVTSLEVG